MIEWEKSAPAKVGLAARLSKDLDRLLAQWPQANIHAVLVVRHGKLVLERYFAGPDERWLEPLGTVQFTRDTKHDVRSISKSVTSLLVGIAAAHDGFPALDSPVIDFFPEYAALRTPPSGASPSAIC